MDSGLLLFFTPGATVGWAAPTAGLPVVSRYPVERGPAWYSSAEVPITIGLVLPLGIPFCRKWTRIDV